MACTGIELKSTQGNSYWARTQDFEQHFEYSGIKIPRNYRMTSTYTPLYNKQSCNGYRLGSRLT